MRKVVNGNRKRGMRKRERVISEGGQGKRDRYRVRMKRKIREKDVNEANEK